MAEESEQTSNGASLLGSLWGALSSLWLDPSPETTEESAPAAEESVPAAKESASAVEATVGEESTLATKESSRQESESSPTSTAHRAADGPEEENPFSIFGLGTPTRTAGGHQEQEDPARDGRKQKGKRKDGRRKKGRQADGGDGAVESRQPAKKSPMRTARDVISRIQWDRNLPEDYFDIGYLDRFLGVVEKPFSSFTWGDLPWQEYDVLAIPQHRIQYFTYRGERVWDKAARLDAVFGSAGTSEDIETAMTRIDAQVEEERERRAAEARLHPGVGADGEGFSESSDDEDGVQVELQPVTPAPPAGGVPEEERSTHFLAVRVTSAAVHAAAERVQQAVVKHDASLTACVMRPALLHVTLCMLRLEDAEAVAAAGRCLRDTMADLEETLRADDRTLRMRGLRTFGARVLYAQVAPCSSFSAAVETLRQRLAATEGVRVTNAFDYVPHMTLVKVSRPVARARRSRFIDAAGYAPLEHEMLGEQRFDNVHLCAIDADCALDGFYLTETSVSF